MADDKKPSPGLKALQYAENDLGVHDVYNKLLKSRAELDEALTTLSEQRDKRRELESHRQDLEMEVVAEERGKHPDMAENRMEKHLKLAFSNHEGIRETREQIMQVVSDIEGVEYDVQILEADIKIGVARLSELGGYLNYLASIKQAEIAREAREAREASDTRDEKDPWK